MNSGAHPLSCFPPCVASPQNEHNLNSTRLLYAPPPLGKATELSLFTPNKHNFITLPQNELNFAVLPLG